MKKIQKNRKHTVKRLLGIGMAIVFFTVLGITTLPITQTMIHSRMETFKTANILRTQSQNLVLTSKVNTEAANGKGGVDLDWSSYDATDKTFKAYQKKEGTDEWQSISTLDFSGNMEAVTILNIYPEVATKGTFTYLDGSSAELPKSASLKVWMEGGSYTDAEGNVTNFEPYGINPTTKQQILYVTPIAASEFNADPSVIWNYDVAMFGTWDTNGGAANQPDDAAIGVIEQYIQAGNGIICGHDTIGYTYNDLGLSKLRKYFNIEVGYWGSEYETKEGTDYKDSWGYQSSYVEVKRNGLLTNFPWELPMGSKLSIPNSHTCANAALGEVWMTFVEGDYWSAVTDPTLNYYSYGKGDGYYYLTTYNNTAMIQTGHSNCESTEDERKVLANTLFYLKQKTSATSFTDNSSQDYKAPNAPTITIGDITSDKNIPVTYQAQDNGSIYSFYVEAYSKADTTNVFATSNEVTEEVATGVKGYYYTVDNQATHDFNIETATYTEDGSYTLDLTHNGQYIHMKAVDKAGNVGPVADARIMIMSKVTVDPNTGILEENPDVVIKNGMVGETIDLGIPQKEGHTFLGWKATKGTINGTQYTFDLEPGIIVAQWKANAYTYTIEYQDKETKVSLHNPKTEQKDYGTTITAGQEVLPIPGYTYDSSTKESITIGVNQEQNTIILYYQKKEATVTVNYLNEQGETIEESETIAGKVFDLYETKAKEIYGYELIEVPENANGSMTEQPIIVEYRYKLKDAKVIVKYVDENGKDLTDPVIKEGKVFENYVTEEKTFPGYEIITKPETSEGEMTEETITVEYVYTLKDGKVIVKYIDTEGHTLAETIVKEGKVFDTYTTEEKTIKGYELTTTPENAEGTIPEEGAIVEYIYTLKDAKVIVQYVDTKGNSIAEPTTITKKFFEDYETKAKEIENYELQQTPNNSKGTLTEETITVTYTYKAVDNTGAPNPIPQTGSKTKGIALGTAIVAAIIGWVGYRRHREI